MMALSIKVVELVETPTVIHGEPSETEAFFFSLITLPLRQNREQNQRHAEGDIEREGLVEDQRPDDDGRQGSRMPKMEVMVAPTALLDAAKIPDSQI